LLHREALGVVEQAMTALPAAQRAVVTLRDVEGLAAAEVCNILEISETNQRVLLHRARSKLRAALERYMAEG
jgi:RNA polymerase sigma-70 factor (ECF subfamily)